ncbi:hypothetical protein [Chloroflexus sp.]|uniref:hypothetical protein n=1 Tax=Chloroflexus sp. TaxID=1904827 RepID=UPI002636153A|nr:hypothetical protein [uncultured Chloroflexus sp.]
MSETVQRAMTTTDLDTLVWQVAALREAFLSCNAVDLSPVRSIIRESWRRCRELAVNADLNLAQFAAPDDHQLRELRELNAPFLRAAHPVLLRLRATLGSVGYVIAVSDAEGTLLDVDGDLTCRRRLARKGLLPGSNWSEAVAGTNAICDWRGIDNQAGRATGRRRALLQWLARCYLHGCAGNSSR